MVKKGVKRPDVAARNVQNTTNLKGCKFGRLTVMEQVGTGSHGAIWHCVCKCGGTVDVPSTQLLAAKKPTRSCGCLQRDKAEKHMRKVGRKPNRFKNLTGQDFERWHVEKFLRFDPKVGAIYLVKCKCGTVAERAGKYLRDKRSTSCGCAQREAAAKINRRS